MGCEWLGWCALKPEAQAAWVQAVFSVVGIAAAVLVARHQSKQARALVESQRSEDRENRKKLATPQLWIERFVQRQAPQLRILLRNDGLGPAVLTEFQVFLDGLPVAFDPQTFWLDLLSELGVQAGVNSGGTTMGANRVIPAGTEIVLLRYEVVDPGLITNAELFRQGNRIEFEYGYESIYGDKFAANDREG